MPVNPTTQGSTDWRIKVQAAWAMKQDPISKITNPKRADRMTQVMEYLP
jgi:hypothetical protein